MEQKRGSRRELFKGNFLLLVASSFLFVMSSYLVIPMLPLYLGEIGAAELEIGFIVGLVPMTAVFTRIPVGRFIDRYGLRLMLVMGILLQASSPFLYTMCDDTTQFVAARILNGVGFAAFAVASHTMVVNLSPKGRLGEVVGIYSICFLAAQGAGPSLSGLLLSGIGFNSTFYVSGMVGLAATAIAVFIAVPRHRQEKRSTGSIKTVLQNRNLVTASLALGMVTIPHGVVNSFFPLHAYSMGIGPEGVGLFFSVYAISTGSSRPFLGAMSDRLGRIRVAVPFAMLAALGMVLSTTISDLAGFLVVGAILGVGVGAAQSSLSALSVDTIPPKLRGQAVGVSSTANDLGLSTGAMGMGPVAMHSGLPLAFGTAAAIVAGGMMAFLGIRKFWKKEETVYT